MGAHGTRVLSKGRQSAYPSCGGERSIAKETEANLFSAAISSASERAGGATHGHAGSLSPATQLTRRPSRPTRQSAGPLIANEVVGYCCYLGKRHGDQFNERSKKKGWTSCSWSPHGWMVQSHQPCCARGPGTWRPAATSTAAMVTTGGVMDYGGKAWTARADTFLCGRLD